MTDLDTTWKLSSDDVCYLFERLMDRLAVNKRNIQLSDITIELQLPTISYSKSEYSSFKNNDKLIDYLISKFNSQNPDLTIENLIDDHHTDDDHQFIPLHNVKEDDNTQKKILADIEPLRPLKSVSPQISPTLKACDPSKPLIPDVNYLYKIKKKTNWASIDNSSDSSDFGNFDLSSPHNSSIMASSIGDEFGCNAEQDLELNPCDDDVIIQSMEDILDDPEMKEEEMKDEEMKEKETKEEETKEEVEDEMKEDEMKEDKMKEDENKIIHEDDIEHIIKKDYGKIKLYNTSKFKKIYELYFSKDISSIIENNEIINEESKHLRRMLLNYRLKGIDKKIYEPYEKLWEFTSNLLIYNKSIKLFPCKDYLRTGICTTNYCTFYHPGEDPIYEFMIKTYCGNLIEEFSILQSNKDLKSFEEFCIKINNYIFYNTICKKRNTCTDLSCSCIHNINEQLLILHLWKTTWKSFGKRNFKEKFTYPSELETNSYKSLWMDFYNI